MATSNEHLGIRLATEIGDAPLTDAQLRTTIYHIDGKLPKSQPTNSTNDLIYVYGRPPAVGSSNTQLRWASFNEFNSGTLLFQSGETGSRNTYSIESIVYKSGSKTLAIIDKLSRPVFNKYIIPPNILNATTSGTYNISWSMPNVDTLNATTVTARLQVTESNYLLNTPITVEIRVWWRFESDDPQFPGSAGEPDDALFTFTIDTANVVVNTKAATPLSQSANIELDSHGCAKSDPNFRIDFETLLNGTVNSDSFTFVPPNPPPNNPTIGGLGYFNYIEQVFIDGIPSGSITIDPSKITFKNVISNRSLDWGTAVYGTTTLNSFTTPDLLRIEDTPSGFNFTLFRDNFRNALNAFETGNDASSGGSNTNISGNTGKIEITFPIYIKDHVVGELFTKNVTFSIDVRRVGRVADTRTGTLGYTTPQNGETTVFVYKDTYELLPASTYSQHDNLGIYVTSTEVWSYGSTNQLQLLPTPRPMVPVQSNLDLLPGQFKVTNIEIFNYNEWKDHFEIKNYNFETNESVVDGAGGSFFPIKINKFVRDTLEGRITYQIRYSDSVGTTCPSYTIIDRFLFRRQIESDYILDSKLMPDNQIISVQNETDPVITQEYEPIKLVAREVHKTNVNQPLILTYVPNARLNNSGQVGVAQLNDGEYSILNINPTVDLNTSNPLELTLTPTQRRLVQPNTPVSVEIEAKGKYGTYRQTVRANIQRRLPTTKVVSVSSIPQEVLVYVDANNNVLEVSHPSIQINAVETDLSNNQNSELFYDSALTTFRRYRIDSISPTSTLISQNTFPNRSITINQTGTFTTDQTISVSVSYKDSNNIPGTTLTSFRLKKVLPQDLFIDHTITPSTITVDVNELTNNIINPNSFPTVTVTLSEKQQSLPSNPLTYNQSEQLNNGQWKITNITFLPNQSFSVPTITPTVPRFTPIGFNLPRDITASVYTEYVDSNGKSGTKIIPFYITRNGIPNERADIRFRTNLDETQRVLVDDKFNILDIVEIDNEIKDLVISGEQLLKNAPNYTSLNYSESLQGTSVWKVRSIRISNAVTNQFVNYIGYADLEIMSKSIKIKFLANEIRSKLKVEVFIDYIDAYMNEGTRTVIHYIEPLVDDPIITLIEYPEIINAADYIGFDVNFTVSYESKYATQIAIYILEEGTFNLYNNRRYGPNDTVQFNMKQLVEKYPIPTEDNDVYTFDMVLVPERRETNGTITVGQKETITIVFNKSNVQIDRRFIIQNLYDVIQPKFNFDVYRDETRKYLTHYLHMDNKEPVVIANWEKDSVTFSEYEEDDLGNQILIRENPTLVLKMYEPLPEDIQPNTSVWITKARS
jgi:hypothetical protein